MITEQNLLKRKHRNQGLRYHSGGVYYDERKQRYVRYYRTRLSPYLKRKCNKQIRRSKEEIASGGSYHKFTEFWNILY